MKKTLYILGFIFNSTFEKVLLIQKNRPDWQKGKLNGLGGHLELGESTAEGISREVREESSLKIAPKDWKMILEMDGVDWETDVFSAQFTGDPSTVVSVTDEKVEWYEVKNLPENVIPNLRWLIPLCQNALQSGVIKKVKVEYNI